MLLDFLTENLSTILVGAAVLAILIAVAVKLRNDKKKHKTSCGCGCTGCLSAGKCDHLYDQTEQGSH